MIKSSRFFLILFFLLPFQTLIAQEIIDESQEFQNKEEFKKHEISFRFGYGFRTARTTDGLEGLAQHINGLKKGPTFKGSYSYYLGSHIGPSVKLSRFWASNETADLKTDTKITFIGVGISTRNSSSPHSALNATLHLGYVAYRESNMISGFPLDVSGNAFGMEGSVIVNISLNDYLSLLLEMGYQLSTLTGVEDSMGNNYQLDESESLNRFDLHSGLKLHL